jgi:N-ethylmaleimide reductase
MKLLKPYNLAGLELDSRITMAPLTRRRCNRLHEPVEIMQTYYSQRASAGLIIAEGTSPSPNGAGYANMPGLYTAKQMTQWKKVTEKVHQKGGKIVLQVMHTGRVSHVNNLDEGAKVLAPSAIAQSGEITTYDFEKQPYPTPKAMSTAEVKEAVAEYAQCANLAMEAGFDGIEIHGAHGYLPNQFFNQSSNHRTDEYGGSQESRLRFLMEVIDACGKAIGYNKVGLRISPFSYADTQENEEELLELYQLLATKLNETHLSYLHLNHMGEAVGVKFELWNSIRKIYKGNLMLCGDFSKESAEQALQNGDADLIAFGRDYIANPDLVERFQNNWPLAERDRTHWYTQGAQGLIDFPKFNDS